MSKTIVSPAVETKINELNGKTWIELGTISNLNISDRTAGAVYHFSFDNTASNRPTGVDYGQGYLYLVPGMSSYGQMIINSYSGSYVRKLIGGTYGDWDSYALNSSITNTYSTSGDWKIRTLPDGTKQCWCGKSITFNGPSTATFGNLYRSNAKVTLPSGVFTAAPYVFVTQAGQEDAWGSVYGIETTEFYIRNYDRYSGDQTRYYYIFAIGK